MRRDEAWLCQLCYENFMVQGGCVGGCARWLRKALAAREQYLSSSTARSVLTAVGTQRRAGTVLRLPARRRVRYAPSVGS